MHLCATLSFSVHRGSLYRSEAEPLNGHGVLTLASVRLRYSGLVLFSSRAFSMVMGLLFTVMVTRRLSVDEFGIWQYISALLGYFIMPSSIVSFWLTRDMARGSKVARVGILTNLMFSFITVGFFAMASYPLSNGIGANVLYFLLCSLQLPEIYLINTLESIANATKPEIFGYSAMTYEASKVLVALIFVVILRTGLTGSIISVIIAYLAQMLMMGLALHRHIDGELNKKAVKRWLSLFWIPTFNAAAGQLLLFDTIILVALTRSTLPVAMLKAAQVFGAAIVMSNVLAAPLYPKLLAGGTANDVDTAYKMVLMFAIPSTLGVVILSEPLLSILRVEYVQARLTLIVIALLSFINSISGVMDAIIAGTEKVDMVNGVSFKKFMHSRLSLLPSLTFIQGIIYLSLLILVTFTLNSLGFAPNVIALCTAIISLIATTPIFIYKYRLAKGVVPFKFPIKAVYRYSLASITMCAALVLLCQYAVISSNISKVLSSLLPIIGAASFTYFTTLFLIDGDFRRLLKLSRDYLVKGGGNRSQ